MKKRNGTIDLMRFVLMCIILLFHGSRNLTDRLLFGETSVAVEFFFIVSGWLMASGIARTGRDGRSLGEETASFLGRKIARLLPDYHIAWLIAFAAAEIAEKADLVTVAQDGVKGIPEFLFLTASGISGRRVNEAVWYVSAMLLSMALLYPAARKYGEGFNRQAAPLIAVFTYGYLYNCSETGLTVPSLWVGFTTKGMLRGLAGISLGCASFSLSGALSRGERSERPQVRRLATAAEIGLHGIFLCGLWKSHDRIVDFVLVLFAFAAVTVSFSGLSLSGKLLDNPLSAWLGDFSYDLFLCHGFWSHVLRGRLEGQSFGRTMGIYAALSFLTALFVMYLSRLIRRMVKKGKGGTEEPREPEVSG